MKGILKYFIIILILGAFFSGEFVRAKSYEYIDDKGHVWYVGSLEDIPKKYRNKPRQNQDYLYDAPQSRVSGKFIEPMYQDMPFDDIGGLEAPLIPLDDKGVPIVGKAFQPEGMGRLDSLLESAVSVVRDNSGFSEKDFLGIKIIGDDFFILWIEKALNILMKQAPMKLQEIRKDIVIIKQGERTMMWVKLDPPVMTITADSATHSSTFTAGIIVHEACHMRLYKEGKSSDPSDYKAIQNEEMVCIAREEIVMKGIGASPQELDMLRKQDGSHFDVDGDGDYDLNDFEKMNW